MKQLLSYRSVTVAAMLALFVLTAQADNVTDNLDPRIRNLLQEEMREIERAMHTILSAIVRGQHDIVQEKGKAIHDSFILAHSLSDTDRRTLRAALPDGFIELDQAFHGLAAELSESAAEQDSAAQLSLFQKMTDSCLGCHQTYTPDRFSRLNQ